MEVTILADTSDAGDEDTGPEFFLQLTEWNENKMAIFVNFTDPLSIKGNNRVITKIKDPSKFRSAADPSMSLDPSKATSVKEVPD